MANLNNSNTVYLICVGKQREGNEIKQYKLKDLFGEVCCIESAVLKNMISSGEVQVSNLTLTGDNRLISYEQKGLKDIKPRKGLILANPNHNIKPVMGKNEMNQGQSEYKNIPTSVYPNAKPVINNPIQSGPHPGPSSIQRPLNNGVSVGSAAPGSVSSNPPIRTQPNSSANETQIDPKNAYGYNSNTSSTMFCVSQNGDLGLMHKPTKQMKKIHSNVSYACYVPQGHNLHIFFIASENGQSVLKHIIYDEGQVKKNQIICECPANMGLGKKCNPTIVKDGVVADKPHYYIAKGNDYIFVPVKTNNGNGYQINGFVIYDVREKAYHYRFSDEFNSSKSVYYLADALNAYDRHEISYSIDYSDRDGEGLKIRGLGLSLYRPDNTFGVY